MDNIPETVLDRDMWYGKSYVAYRMAVPLSDLVKRTTNLLTKSVARSLCGS